MQNDNKPYVFPEEMPEKDQKLDKGVIIDVVENETNPKNMDDSQCSVLRYMPKD